MVLKLLLLIINELLTSYIFPVRGEVGQVSGVEVGEVREGEVGGVRRKKGRVVGGVRRKKGRISMWSEGK